VYGEVNSVLYVLINGSCIASAIFAIVLNFFGCRNNFINIVNIIRRKIEGVRESEIKDDDEDSDIYFNDDLEARIQKANKEYKIFTVCLYATMLINAAVLNSIDIIFNFLGAVCQSLMTIILPCLFYVTLVRRERQPRYLHFYVAWGLLIVVVPCSIVSVVATYIHPN
jgi:amino acid permease